jgi:hypothetical protein
MVVLKAGGGGSTLKASAPSPSKLKPNIAECPALKCSNAKNLSSLRQTSGVALIFTLRVICLDSPSPRSSSSDASIQHHQHAPRATSDEHR